MVWLSLFLWSEGICKYGLPKLLSFFERLKTVWDNFSYETIVSEYDWEPGFITLVYFFKSIIPNYSVWIFVWTLIILITLNFLFSRYLKYYSFGFLLFFIFDGYGIVTNLMRGCIAMSLFYIQYNILKEVIVRNIS